MTPEQIAEWEEHKRLKLDRDRFGECWADRPGKITPNTLCACNAPVETAIGLCAAHYLELSGRDVSQATPVRPLPIRTKEGYWVDG